MNKPLVQSALKKKGYSHNVFPFSRLYNLSRSQIKNKVGFVLDHGCLYVILLMKTKPKNKNQA
uniref:Uncharacterized protein n=1 Tax=Anguilla anguilla TaxID=7936 RepID=A0A0E9VFQ3_ANGAN